MSSNNQNISVIDFNKICRICMSEGNLVNIFSHCETEGCIFEMLSCCTLTMVSEKDELPDKICLQCLDELKAAYTFYQKSEVSDSRLHKLLEKSKQTDQVNNSPSTKSKIQLNRMQSILKNKLDMSTTHNDTIVDSDSDTAFKDNIHNDHDYITAENICEKENNTPNENCTENNTDAAANSSKPSNGYIYECTKCSKPGLTYRELRIHWMTVHGAKYAERECEVCKKLIGFKEFNQHIRSHPQYKPFACDLCDAKFRFKSVLVRHKVIHLSEKPYSCDKCDKRFSRLANLQKHVTRQSCNSKKKDLQEGYLCHVCNRWCRTRTSLYQHSLIHRDKKYLCWYCGKNFTTCGGLLTHVKIHTGVKPHRCTYCPKSFIQSRALKMHTFTHTGERPYICEYCSKSFSQIQHLKRHIRMHTGVKPHKCSICAKCYVTSSTLRIHMRRHTGITPYVCEECGKGFYVSNHLQRHMKMHARIRNARNN